MDTPIPPAVAALPRDPRGFPVLVITPWRDGVPAFGFTGPDRVLVCAVERRCAICGRRLDLDDGVFRVVGAAEAEAMVRLGTAYDNETPTVEPPGHRACMLYAAMVCPFLARPNARRGQDVSLDGFDATRGTARGLDGAVAGFTSYEFTAGLTVSFRFRGLREVAPHRLGAEHGPALRAAIATAGPDDDRCPPWLGVDEAMVAARAAIYR